jgi:heat-inducible transcriptional repressor
MSDLEEEGYITRPHTSSGCIPLPKGYRNYVESLSDTRLPLDEQKQIRDLFMEATDEVDRWLRLAAVLISRLVGNAAVVSYPRAEKRKFKHLELVSMHDFLALLILVLSEATLKQQLISFKEPVSQDRLTKVSNKLNAEFSGLNGLEISSSRQGLTPLEKQVSQVVTDIMYLDDSAENEETYLEGLRLMLNQPEFIKKERMLEVVELLETRDRLGNLMNKQIEKEDRKVVIGEESGEKELYDLSLVIGRYGVPNRLGGTIGVIGPTRMDYRRAISTVDYISGILSYLMAEVCPSD